MILQIFGTEMLKYLRITADQWCDHDHCGICLVVLPGGCDPASICY